MFGGGLKSREQAPMAECGRDACPPAGGFPCSLVSLSRLASIPRSRPAWRPLVTPPPVKTVAGSGKYRHVWVRGPSYRRHRMAGPQAHSEAHAGAERQQDTDSAPRRKAVTLDRRDQDSPLVTLPKDWARSSTPRSPLAQGSHTQAWLDRIEPRGVREPLFLCIQR